MSSSEENELLKSRITELESQLRDAEFDHEEAEMTETALEEAYAINTALTDMFTWKDMDLHPPALGLGPAAFLVLMEKPVLGSRVQVMSYMGATPTICGRFLYDFPDNKILKWMDLPEEDLDLAIKSRLGRGCVVHLYTDPVSGPSVCVRCGKIRLEGEF